MKKILSFLAVLTACLVLFWFIDLPDLDVSAEEEQDLIELSNDDYANYVSDLLRPLFFTEFFNGMSASAEVSLIKEKDYQSTNVPKPSGAGSASSSITTGLRDLGSQIIKDIINDSVVDNSGFRIPEFHQQTGKLRNVYNSGMVEIITCTMTTYQTPVIGVLGEPTGTYDNHCILTFMRQIDDYYTVTTICDDASVRYCDTYTEKGTYIFISYSQQSFAYYLRFFDAITQETILNHQILGTGTLTKFKFSDLGEMDEFPSVFDSSIYFLIYDKKGLPEFSSGSQYRSLVYIITSNSVYSSSQGNTSFKGCVFAVSNTLTNDYQEYSQRKEENDTAEQKQAITYLSDLNTTNIINNTNIDNYNFLTIEGDKLVTTNNFSSWYQSNVTNVVNNNLTNVYNYYWIAPTEPPTEPPSEPPVTIPTQPIQTQLPETVPSASLPSDWLDDSVQLDTAHYTINYEVLESNFVDLQDIASLPEGAIKGTGMLFHVASDVFEETGVLPYFLAIGIVFLVISFL